MAGIRHRVDEASLRGQPCGRGCELGRSANQARGSAVATWHVGAQVQPPLPGRGFATATDSSPSLSKPIAIPFSFEGGHIIVEASIDASPPKPFLFDTGARNLITPEVARTLNAAVPPPPGTLERRLSLPLPGRGASARKSRTSL